MSYIVAFDIKEKNIVIAEAEEGADSLGEVKKLHFNERIFSEEFFAEFKTLLQGYLENFPPKQKVNLVYAVLPDECIGFETFNLPNMRSYKLEQALETELSNQFEAKSKEKKVKYFILTHSKQYNTVGVVLFDKPAVNSLLRVFGELKLLPRAVTYRANARLNGVFSVAPKMRGKSFLFADVLPDHTEIVVSSKGKTLGFVRIPHGTNILNENELENEYMRTEHNTGELAVLNAREIARARALTTAEIEEEEANAGVSALENALPEDATFEDYAVEGPAEGEYSGDNPSDQHKKIEALAEFIRDDTVTEPVKSEEEKALLAEEEAITLSEAAAVNEESNKPTKVKVFRKVPKRYPKFMQRELPVDREGYLFENFRIIAKWILLYARSAELSEYTSSPEFVLVNLPEQYRFLLDKMNEEQGENGLQFKALVAEEEDSVVTQNLDLFGCLFAKQYNKSNNY